MVSATLLLPPLIVAVAVAVAVATPHIVNKTNRKALVEIMVVVVLVSKLLIVLMCC